MRLLRALVNFCLIVALLTAFKLWKDAQTPRAYAHDPYCERLEPVYALKPCKVWANPPPRTWPQPPPGFRIVNDGSGPTYPELPPGFRIVPSADSASR